MLKIIPSNMATSRALFLRASTAEAQYFFGTTELGSRLKTQAKVTERESLKFELHGEKLNGRWMLVRKGGRRTADEKTWFLFKEKDEFAKPDSDITADEPMSVTTGRELETIAASADRIWGPNGEINKRRKRRKNHPAIIQFVLV